MIVSALSTAMSRYMTDSLDDAKLKEGAVSISIDKDAHVLSGLTLAGFIEKDFVSVRLHTDLRTLVEAVARSKRNIFPVLDLEDKLVGIITLEDIREIMFQTDLYDTTLVNQLMRKPVVTAELNEGMGSVMEKFDKTGVWNIPVLHEDKYVGFISKSRIFSNYRDRLKNE